MLAAVYRRHCEEVWVGEGVSEDGSEDGSEEGTVCPVMSGYSVTLRNERVRL